MILQLKRFVNKKQAVVNNWLTDNSHCIEKVEKIETIVSGSNIIDYLWYWVKQGTDKYE